MANHGVVREIGLDGRVRGVGDAASKGPQAIPLGNGAEGIGQLELEGEQPPHVGHAWPQLAQVSGVRRQDLLELAVSRADLGQEALIDDVPGIRGLKARVDKVLESGPIDLLRRVGQRDLKAAGDTRPEGLGQEFDGDRAVVAGREHARWPGVIDPDNLKRVGHPSRLAGESELAVVRLQEQQRGNRVRAARIDIVHGEPDDPMRPEVGRSGNRGFHLVAPDPLRP